MPALAEGAQPYPSLAQLLADRDRYFPALSGTVYLDWAGAGLAQKQQLMAAARTLSEPPLLCNPHANSACSAAATAAVEAVRGELRKFLGAEDYELVFTSGATGALALLGSAFPWANGSRLVMLRDNHQSVLALRDPARRGGATVNVVRPEELTAMLADPTTAFSTARSLVALPTQSNFDGTRYPAARLVAEVRQARPDWLTVVDVAASAASSPTDLRALGADFVVLSFYKLWGFPTGVGALLVRKSAVELLATPFLGGGTVAVACPSAGAEGAWKFVKERGGLAERLEAGTIDYQGIVALREGLAATSALGGMARVREHTAALALRLARGLAALRHGNGARLVQLLGRWDTLVGQGAVDDTQGPTVAFLLYHANGSALGYHTVTDAARGRFDIRAGMLCNPGALFGVEGAVSEEQAALFAAAKETCGDDTDIVDERHYGAVRASLGYASTEADVDAFVAFVGGFRE